MTPEKVAYALQLLAEPDRTMSSIAKMVGISRSTLHKMLPELVSPAAAQQRLDAQIAVLPADARPGPPTLERYDELLVTPCRPPGSLTPVPAPQ